MYLFYQNKKLIGVFDDIQKMKKDITLYLIKYHLSNKSYSNLQEAKDMLREKIKNLFAEDLYFMENFNNTWLIKIVENNKIYKEIKITNYETRYTKLNIKGKNWTKRELSKNLPFLELSNYYN